MIKNFVNKIKNSLTKTRTQFMSSLGNILPFGGKITDEVLDEVEEVIAQAPQAFQGRLGFHGWPGKLHVGALHCRTDDSQLQVFLRPEMGEQSALAHSGKFGQPAN